MCTSEAQRVPISSLLTPLLHHCVVPGLLSLQPSPVPSPSNTDLLLNELIREYLVFHHYGHALSVFLSEANQPAQAPFDRAFLARELGLVDSTASRSTPLLYHLLSHAQQQAKHRGEEVKGGAGGRRAESAGAGDGRELLTRSALSGEDEVVPGDRRKSDGPRPLHVDRSTMY